jgi:G2/mitotic-specific cyclin 2
VAVRAKHGVDVLVGGRVRGSQPLYQPSTTYMDRQTDLSWRMRSTLVDWLVGIHWQYKWQAETLLLAVNLLDRYLSRVPVERTRLQLVGATSMLIACKYEQIYTPYIHEFNYLCEEMYTKQDFITTERAILVALEYRLGQPSAMTYLRRISKAENYDIATRTIAKYLVESSILSERFLAYTPSVIAAASILAARRMRAAGPWDATMAYYSGYDEATLAPCVDDFAAFLHGNTKYRAIYRKFSGKPFLRASQFVEQHLQKTAGRI